VAAPDDGASVLGEDELENGLMFDGSSIEGWKAINDPT
jgi:glutamine synthetase